jgi:uncharacterized phiE125 gp8 family phage protein
MPSLDSNAWCTLNDAKEQLHIGVSESDFDDQLINLVNRGYKILENYIGHQIKSATYTEYYNGDDTGELMLRNWPIVSITSIHIDQDGDRSWESDELINSANYYYDADNGIIEFVQATGTGPTWFEPGIKNIKVIYVAGYATIPNELVHALVMYVAWLFNRTATEGTTTMALGGKTEVYDHSFLPNYIRRILDKFKHHQL